MNKIIKAISIFAPVALIYVVVILCFVWWGSELLNKMDQRAEAVGKTFYEVGR